MACRITCILTFPDGTKVTASAASEDSLGEMPITYRGDKARLSEAPATLSLCFLVKTFEEIAAASGASFKSRHRGYFQEPCGLIIPEGWDFDQS